MKIYIHTTIYFYQVKVFPKVTNTHLYINQKEIKQEIFKNLHITWLPKLSMWFHMHNKMAKTFHMNHHVKVKYINWNFDQIIIKLWISTNK